MYKRLLEIIRSHQTIGIFSHLRPDADALGAQIALGLWLKGMGKTVYAFNPDPFPPNLKWMQPYFPVQVPDRKSVASCDACIFVDGNSLVRFGEEAERLEGSGKPLLLIDHHPDPESQFDHEVSVPGLGSASELVYELICEDNPAGITPEISRMLYAGIVTDTGSFRFDSVRPRTHQIAADLLEAGKFAPNEIHERIYDNNELKHLKLLGLTLKNIELFYSNQLATMSVTQTMLDETGCSYEDLEGFVAYPLSLKETKAAFLLCEKDGKVKLSLRSKSALDVNKLARNFDGGGHQKAAGGWHPGPIDQAVQDIIQEAAKQLD